MKTYCSAKSGILVASRPYLRYHSLTISMFRLHRKIYKIFMNIYLNEQIQQE